MNNYDDIINLERPKSKYPKMSISARAAEFSSFDALEGYNELIKKSTIIKEKRKELSEEDKEIINNKIKELKTNNTKLKIVYYDEISLRYKEIIDTFKKIDDYNKVIILNNINIKIDNILSIDIII